MPKVRFLKIQTKSTPNFGLEEFVQKIFLCTQLHHNFLQSYKNKRMMQVDLLAAKNLEGKIHTSKTKTGYLYKVYAIGNYLNKNYPESAEFINEKYYPKLPLSREVIISVFGWISRDGDLIRSKKGKKRKHTGDEISQQPAAEEGQATASAATTEGSSADAPIIIDTFSDNIATISSSCYQGYKSALKWYYQLKKLPFEAWSAGMDHTNQVGLDTELNALIRAYKGTVASKKTRGVMSVNEGKSFLSFAGYEMIAKFMMMMRPTSNTDDKGVTFTYNEGLFSWCWLTLQWNLISRSINVEEIMLEHIDWHGDCLKITFAKTKGDQTGEGLANDKHLYANNINPSVCPILALAVFMFCKPTREKSADPNVVVVFSNVLFDGGNDQKGRFSKILASVLKHIAQNIDLGCTRKDIGTHSIRKGGATFLLNTIDGPTVIMVYLRAGWTLENVADRYIHAGTGGDQLVGRAVTGLPLHNQDFATLCPHFTQEGLNYAADVVGWENLMPGYNLFPQCFRRVIPYLLAVILYHKEFLLTNLSVHHTLFQRPLFTQVDEIHLVKLQSFIRTGTNICQETGMRATGIPGHLSIMAAIQELTTAIQNLQQMIEQSQVQLQDAFLAAVAKLPESLKNMIDDHYHIDGVRELNKSDVQLLINETMERHSNIILSKMQKMFNRFQPAGNNNVNNAVIITASQGTGENIPIEDMYPLHYYNGQYHYLPEQFKFFTGAAKTNWSLWHFGNKLLKIGPYKNLSKPKWRTHVPPKEGPEFNKIAKIMEELTDIARAQWIGTADEFKITRDNHLSMFDAAFPLLLVKCYKEGKIPVDPDSMCTTTLAKNFYIQNKVN